MSDQDPPAPDDPQLRLRALSRWENEGGAISGEPQVPAHGDAHVPALTNTELVQLRIRVIALENLLIALMADASEAQVARVREMADCISPRPGATPHPLTVSAANQMCSLVDRARHFRERGS